MLTSVEQSQSVVWLNVVPYAASPCGAVVSSLLKNRHSEVSHL